MRGVGIQLTKLEKCPPMNSALSNFLQHPTTSKSVDKQAVPEKQLQNKNSKINLKKGQSLGSIKTNTSTSSHNYQNEVIFKIVFY